MIYTAHFFALILPRKVQYEEHKTQFEGTYLRKGWMDSTEIWYRMCPT